MLLLAPELPRSTKFEPVPRCVCPFVKKGYSRKKEVLQKYRKTRMMQKIVGENQYLCRNRCISIY
jgi:hypothetical protein